MSMTKEEAIEALQKFVNGYEKNICGEAVRQNGFVQAIKVVISALHPVSREQELEAENKELKERIVNWRKYMTPTREQVEKVWRGCEYCKKHKINLVRIEMDYNDSPGSPERLNPTRIPKFCPICGAPMTDEAVETIMKRMEEMRND